MSQGTDTPKTPPSAQPADFPLSNDPLCESPAHRRGFPARCFLSHCAPRTHLPAYRQAGKAGLAGHIPAKVSEGRPLRSIRTRDCWVADKNVIYYSKMAKLVYDI
jgi:hypothetical protein